MCDEFLERVNKFNNFVENTKVFLSIVRDSSLQQAEVINLSELLVIVSDWKREAVEESNENRANLFLGMECTVAALSAELKMWLLLKEDKPEDAWNSLIDAQSATIAAMRAHKKCAHLEDYAKRLEAVEKVVFPPQVFLSTGLIVRRQICTICNTDYDGCPHLVGMPYWGQICCRSLEEFSVDHVSIVDDPANKRCRVTHVSDEGGNRNRMTWRIEPAEGQGQEGGDQKELITTGTILEASDLISNSE